MLISKAPKITHTTKQTKMPIDTFDICPLCNNDTEGRRAPNKPRPLRDGACSVCNIKKENEEYCIKAKFSHNMFYRYTDTCKVCRWNCNTHDLNHIEFADLYDDQWRRSVPPGGFHKKQIEEMLNKQGIAVGLYRLTKTPTQHISKGAADALAKMIKEEEEGYVADADDDDHGSVLSNETFGDNYYGEECGDEN